MENLGQKTLEGKREMKIGIFTLRELVDELTKVPEADNLRVINCLCTGEVATD
jgi:hypothetical protein